MWWWINGESKQFKQFVQNRVENTRSLWSKEHWRYCPSDLNPSDIASRGSKASDLVSSDLWWNGAPFLEKEERQWPNVPNCPITEEKVTSEAGKESKVGDTTKTSSFMTVSSKVSQSVSEVIQPERFSSFSRLIRVTGLVLKFIRKVKRSMETQPEHLNMREIIAAEHLWYKEMQMKLDEKEKSSTVWEQLGVFKDADGVLRCKGRIQNCSIPYSAKFPVLLRRKQYFTQLVLRQSHENVKHNGVRGTLTEVHSKFWIIKGRQAVKDVLFKCVICKKMLGKLLVLSPLLRCPPLGSRMTWLSLKSVWTLPDRFMLRISINLVGRCTSGILLCLRAPALELSTLNLRQTCLRIHLYEF